MKSEKVVCVDTLKFGYVYPNLKIDGLTIGKQYDVIRCNTIGSYQILNDIGSDVWYPGRLFMNIETYREKRINSIIDG
jgi:hypothetical protein